MIFSHTSNSRSHSGLLIWNILYFYWIVRVIHLRRIDKVDKYLPFWALVSYVTAAYIASQKPSRQCSCRIEPHRNLHCMPGSGQSKGLSEKAFHTCIETLYLWQKPFKPRIFNTKRIKQRVAKTVRIKRRMAEEEGVEEKKHKKPWQGPLVELWHREHPVCRVTGWSPSDTAANDGIGMRHQPIKEKQRACSTGMQAEPSETQ